MSPAEAYGLLSAEAAGIHVDYPLLWKAREVAKDVPQPECQAPTLPFAQLCMRCTEEGGCLLWNQGLLSSGYPQARIDGKPVMVGRYVYEVLLGKKVRKGYCLTTNCNNRLCVAPCCLVQLTYGERLKRCYATGARSAVTEYRGRAERVVKQGIAKCSFEIAEDIRQNRMHVPTKQLAAELGVGRSAVDDMKAGRTWRSVRPTSSVFDLGSCA